MKTAIVAAVIVTAVLSFGLGYETGHRAGYHEAQVDLALKAVSGARALYNKVKGKTESAK